MAKTYKVKHGDKVIICNQSYYDAHKDEIELLEGGEKKETTTTQNKKSTTTVKNKKAE